MEVKSQETVSSKDNLVYDSEPLEQFTSKVMRCYVYSTLLCSLISAGIAKQLDDRKLMTTEAVFLILFFTGYSLYSATLSLLAFLIEMSYNAKSPPPPNLNKTSALHAGSCLNY